MVPKSHKGNGSDINLDGNGDDQRDNGADGKGGLCDKTWLLRRPAVGELSWRVLFYILIIKNN